jgi:hypothetical protein
MRTLLVLTKQASLAAAIQAVLDPGKFQIIVKETVAETEMLLARGAIDATVLGHRPDGYAGHSARLKR